MDIDFRWGGDPNIVLGVEAALVASIPIQVGMTTIWMTSTKSSFVWSSYVCWFLFLCNSILSTEEL